MTTAFMDDLVDQLKDFFMTNSRRMSFPRINDQARESSLESNRTPSHPSIIVPAHTVPPIIHSHTELNRNEQSPSGQLLHETRLKKFRIYGNDSLDMVSIENCRERLLEHLSRLFQTEDIKFNEENTDRTIEIVGTLQQQESVMNYLSNLFQSIQIKLYDDKQNGSWIRIDDVIDFLQFHFNQSSMICCWKRISIDVIAVKYFSTTDYDISTDEIQIHDYICKQFAAANISYNQTRISQVLIEKFNESLNNILIQDHYKKSIVLSHQKSFIHLFGLHDQIKQTFIELNGLKKKHNLVRIQPQLSDKQWKYISVVRRDDLMKLQKRYRDSGSDVDLLALLSSRQVILVEEIAIDLHHNLRNLSQIEDLQFVMIGSSLVTWIRTNIDRLSQMYSSQCLIEYKTATEIIRIDVPRAPISDQDQLQRSHVLAKGQMKILCQTSTIQVVSGDLGQQQVDMIVVNSTSDLMIRDIVQQAAGTVNQELEQSRSELKKATVTSSGRLNCKKIAFVPFQPVESDMNSLDNAIKFFISQAVEFAIIHSCKSLAIPNLDWKKIGYQPSLIAQKVITTTKDILETGHYQITLFFVISPSERAFLNGFHQYVEKQWTFNLQNDLPSGRQTSKTLEYRKINTVVTLTGSNRNSLLKYQNEIQDMTSSKIITEILHNKSDVGRWSQSITEAFYEFCLALDVIPNVNFAEKMIVLHGTHVATQRCQLHYIELNNRLLEQACILMTSCGVTWLFETTMNSNDWQEFSLEHNAIIENAFLKRRNHIDISINPHATMRIDLSKMEARTRQCTQRIQRWNKNSILPKTWNLSKSKSNRYILSINSKEYTDVLDRFNETMKRVSSTMSFHGAYDSHDSNCQYTKIISIERIQNEGWYTQFYTLREDFLKKGLALNEELLFRGCSESASNTIIETCFGSSLSRNDDVQYGYGVYFYRDAISSHKHTNPNQHGERRMFLARVLVSKSCIGDKTMKSPPSDFHSTTDGNKIVVIYDDASAYAEYLITYT